MESVSITGTPFRLIYSSERMPGRIENSAMRVVLSDSSVPTSLDRIDLQVDVGGTTFSQSFPPAPNQVVLFTWDRKDRWPQTAGQTARHGNRDLRLRRRLRQDSQLCSLCGLPYYRQSRSDRDLRDGNHHGELGQC